MCASVSDKKQCATCSKSAGIFTCNGCQQAFCSKHSIEHRQELNGQLDNIMQEHDLFRQQLEQKPLKKNPLLKKIDKWEKDSIAKIQAAAETARKTLQELLEQSKERLSKVCYDVKENLCSSHEADDFSENDLIRWKNQLKELQSDIISPSSAKLIQDKSAPIYIMKLESNISANNQSSNNKEPPPTKNSSKPNIQERFLQKLGPVHINEGGDIAQHVGQASDKVYLRGQYLYSRNCFTIGFKLEKYKQPYRIFFGCMSSQTALNEDVFKSSGSVGWFGSNQVYEHGRCSSNAQKYGYNTNKIQPGDTFYLTLDCTKRQITLLHERLKKTYTLSIDLNSAPFPWQFLMVLCNPGDSVRILHNA